MKRLISEPHRCMRLFGWIGVLIFLAVVPVFAQEVPPDFPTIPAALEKQLTARASNVNEVTLNKNMLNFGGQFLDPGQKGDSQAKQIIQKLDGIYVREYEFSNRGAYTQKDLETIRGQFLGPQWNPMIKERSLKEESSTDVYLKMINGEIHGMFILDAEPTELSLVYIPGSIDLKELRELSGNFGIPKIDSKKSSAKSTR